jgi:flagellar basal-body rod protein FlgF
VQGALQVGLSAQIALRDRLETIAHNMANVSTPGFRAEQSKFDQAVARLGAGKAPVAFVEAKDPYLSRLSGGVTKTDGPLDVAVLGEAYISLDTPQGQVFTRDGRMFLSPTGMMVSVEGYPVLDIGGAPLQLNPGGSAPVIARDGMISQDGRQVGAIGLFAIDPEARLQRGPNSGVIPDRPPTAALDFARNGVIQGFIENSNVSGVSELSRLIAVERMFENVVNTVGAAESSTVDAIRTLGGATS